MKCAACEGYGRVAYRETPEQKQSKYDKSIEMGDGMRAAMIASTGLAITAMVCQVCDGKGEILE